MEIYVTRTGDTLFSVGARFGVPPTRLAAENGLLPDATLAVGQALVILTAETVHTVREGETLAGIAAAFGVSVRALYRNNPALHGLPTLYPGQTLVIRFTDTPTVPVEPQK